jgi:hypothetical protein
MCDRACAKLHRTCDFDALPEAVQKLHYGVAHYSKSFWRDYWVAVKNKHVLLGLALAHPQHTFDRLERSVALGCSLTFACGLMFFINFVYVDHELFEADLPGSELAPEGTVYMLASVGLGLAIQAPYELVLRWLITCDCVQTWRDGGWRGRWKRRLDGCGCAAVALNILAAIAMVVAGVLVFYEFYLFNDAPLVARSGTLARRLADEGDEGDEGDAVSWGRANDALEFTLVAYAITRAISFCGSTFISIFVFFCWTRYSEHARAAASKDRSLFRPSLVAKHGWRMTTWEALPDEPPFACWTEPKEGNTYADAAAPAVCLSAVELASHSGQAGSSPSVV